MQGNDEDAGQILAAFCKLTEGCRLTAYKDPNSKSGLPITIGYGSTRRMDGGAWNLGDSVTQSEADELLERDVREALEPLVNIPNWSSMTAGQKASLGDLNFNEGYSYQDGDHDTLDRLLLNRNWNAVPRQLLEYRDKGTPGELGLARRRYAEGLLWQGATPQNAYEKAWRMDSVERILAMF